MRKIHVFLVLFSSALAFYSDSGPVVNLTSKNFNSEFKKSKDVWMVEFYAPWCGHCKSLKPEWEKAAKALLGVAKVGAVDMTTDQDLGAPYNIQGFPTLKIFGESKSSPKDYNGGRTAKDIVDAAMKEVNSMVNQRLGGKGGDDKKKSNSNKGGSDDKGGKKEDVIVLTDANFGELVLESKDLWLIEFYAPWCGHCKQLEPAWAKAATKLKGQVKVAKVDATENQSLASRYGVQGYPTIKIFPPEGKDKPEDYNGPRDADGIINTALAKMDQYGVVPELVQLTSQDVFDDSCKSGNSVCILAFLPHIYDSNAIQRNAYLDTLTETMKKNSGNPLSFMWAQGGDHFQFEDKFNLSFGYPAVIAVSPSKSRFAIMRAAFTDEGLLDFTKGVLAGKQSLNSFQEYGKISKVAKWDGKDAKPPQDDL